MRYRHLLLQELGDIQKQPIPNVTVSTQEDDLTQWEVVMAGPVRQDLSATSCGMTPTSGLT